jgi:hypothetical protein
MTDTDDLAEILLANLKRPPNKEANNELVLGEGHGEYGEPVETPRLMPDGTIAPGWKPKEPLKS